MFQDQVSVERFLRANGPLVDEQNTCNSIKMNVCERNNKNMQMVATDAKLNSG